MNTTERRILTVLGAGATVTSAVALGLSLKYSSDSDNRSSDLQATINAFRTQKDSATTLVVEMPTFTPTNTLPPSPIPTEKPTDPVPVAVSQGIETHPIIEVAAAPAARQEATEVPPTPAPTQEPVSTHEAAVIDPNQVYSGEFVFNNYEKIYGETPALVQAAKQELIKEINAYNNATDQKTKDNILRTNPVIASLINPMGQGIASDPVANPGLGQTAEDVADGKMIDDLIATKDTLILASQILHTNSKGISTAEVWVDRNNIDAGLAWLATGLATHRGLSDNSIANLWSNAQGIATIRWWEDQFYSQIQKKDLGIGKIEQSRRSDPNNTTDISKMLPALLQGSTDAISCDRDEMPLDALNRTDQRLNIRDVTHQEQPVEDFNNANTEHEVDLLVLSLNENTGFWDLDGFTFRSYNGPVKNQVDSTVGEEMINCKPIPTPVPAEQSQSGEVVVSGESGQTINTPRPGDTPVFRATPGPSSTAQEVITTPTPVKHDFSGTYTPVATGANSPMPTIAVRPTDPPAQAPSSTPAI